MRPQRLITDIIIFLAIFWLPWWVLLAFACICVFVFEGYIELILAGILFDSLYSISNARFAHIQFLATITALALLLFAGFVKRQLRVHLYL